VCASAEQAELRLSVDRPASGPPYIITLSGIKVPANWGGNIVVDAQAPTVTWKAIRGPFGSPTSIPGASRPSSENTEDALFVGPLPRPGKDGVAERDHAAPRLPRRLPGVYWRLTLDAAHPPNRLELRGKLE